MRSAKYEDDYNKYPAQLWFGHPSDVPNSIINRTHELWRCPVQASIKYKNRTENILSIMLVLFVRDQATTSVVRKEKESWGHTL